MMDPFVFDQCDGDEEAIDSAMIEARKRRKKVLAILQVAAFVHALDPAGTYSLQDPESDEYDRWNEGDGDANSEDEIFNS